VKVPDSIFSTLNPKGMRGPSAPEREGKLYSFVESGIGLPHSKTLARRITRDFSARFWSAAVLSLFLGFMQSD
jgi:hypothetical protein